MVLQDTTTCRAVPCPDSLSKVSGGNALASNFMGRLRQKTMTGVHLISRAVPGLTHVVSLICPMFCPQCKAEYRPGFSRCSDCEVDLVDHLPVESYRSTLAPLEAQRKRVWLSYEQGSCVYVCAGLSAAGIPFEVTQGKHQISWNEDERYEIWVPTEFYDKAKAIAEEGHRCDSQKETTTRRRGR
jgi:hypothetical protein